MIEVITVSKSYHQEIFALQNISFKLQPATMTAIVGPSGCGKTTLLKILAGFLTADSGRILFNDIDVTDLPIQKRGAAMVFQNYALWPHMTIFDNIAYGLKLKKLPPELIAQKVQRISEVVEIDPGIIKKRFPGELSGGQQQRVALARALAVDPQIILLDEPLSNLDAKIRQKLRVEIRAIQKRLKVTALYVTHDQEEALSISDSVMVMNQGNIMQIGSPEAVYARPANDFVAEFLGNSNILTGQVREGNIHIEGAVIGQSSLADGPVKVIFRALDLSLNKNHDSGIIFNGQIVEKMFSGGYFRYLIQIGQTTVFMDTTENLEPGTITVGVAKEKLHIFPL
jgi:ABC-type Fe3+/spermidine/putrescine transport system ATPase subunit